jgi:AcrR family transcriptional regulator
MAPRTEEQFEEIRNEKVELIMTTALELFANNGYDSTSISKIAKAAGISKGLMYNYFQSKEALLAKIMMSGMDSFLHFLQVEDMEHIKKEELIRFIDGNLDSLKQNTDYYKLYFSLVFQPKVFKILGNDFMIIFEQLIEKFVLYFTQNGVKNPYVKARFILAIFDGVGIHYIGDVAHFPLDDVRELIIEML